MKHWCAQADRDGLDLGELVEKLIVAALGVAYPSIHSGQGRF